MKFSIYRKGSKDEIITIEYENGQNKWLLAITAAIESWANLSGADLSEADLTKANLAGANLDYCGFTFACKTFDIKADLRLAAQLAYHFCRLDFQDCEEAKQAQATLKELANKFHRVDECGEIGGAGEGC